MSSDLKISLPDVMGVKNHYLFDEIIKVKALSEIFLSHRHVALLLACCGVVAFFFAVVNPAELSYPTPNNSLLFSNLPENPELLNSGMNGARSEA
jgi:hypothetical protein